MRSDAVVCKWFIRTSRAVCAISLNSVRRHRRGGRSSVQLSAWKSLPLLLQHLCLHTMCAQLSLMQCACVHTSSGCQCILAIIFGRNVLTLGHVWDVVIMLHTILSIYIKQMFFAQRHAFHILFGRESILGGQRIASLIQLVRNYFICAHNVNSSQVCLIRIQYSK